VLVRVIMSRSLFRCSSTHICVYLYLHTYMYINIFAYVFHSYKSCLLCALPLPICVICLPILKYSFTLIVNGLAWPGLARLVLTWLVLFLGLQSSACPAHRSPRPRQKLYTHTHTHPHTHTHS